MADGVTRYLAISGFTLRCPLEALSGHRTLTLCLRGPASEPSFNLRQAEAGGVWTCDDRIELSPAVVNKIAFHVELSDSVDLGVVTLEEDDLAALLFVQQETVVEREFVGDISNSSISFVVSPYPTDPVGKANEYLNHPFSFDPALLQSPAQDFDQHPLDIQTSISHFTNAVNLLPPDHLSFPRALYSLGTGLMTQAIRSGDHAGVSRAISLLQRAINATSPTHQDYSMMVNTLAIAFAQRYAKTEAPTDLSYLTTAAQAAIDSEKLSEKGIDPGQSTRIGELSIMRFQRDGGRDLNEISNAIFHLQDAISATPKKDPERAGRLSTLGRAHSLRFKCSRKVDDLDKAVVYEQEAVDLTPGSDPGVIMRLTRLADTLSDRYEATGNTEDVGQAIKACERALANSHVDRLGVRHLTKFTLGYLSVQRFDRLGDTSDLWSAIAHASSVALDPTCPTRLRLNCASMWAVSAMKANDLSQASAGCSACLTLLPVCTALEQTTQERFSNLSEIFSMGITCTKIALHFNELEMAVDCFEQGRCVVWTQIEHFQTPTDRLAEYNPGLAQRFKETARRLQLAGADQRHRAGTIIKFTDREPTDRIRAHAQLAKEWKDILTEIRSLPTFSTFLRPPDVPTILERIPQHGHIVLLNLAYSGCEALCLTTGRGITHVALKPFGAPQAQELADDLSRYLREQGTRKQEAKNAGRGLRVEREPIIGLEATLAGLWIRVVKPILDALRISPASSSPHRPRIWWCPTGALAFLPLHAAGIYGTPGDGACVSDYVVSSYTPNISALLRKLDDCNEQHIQPKPTNILLVSQSDTPGLSPLPYTDHEIASVKSLLDDPKNDIANVTLESSKATITNVIETVQNHSWAHFACHAIQMRADPLASGIHLYDGRLTLHEFMKQSILTPKMDHVFLSACETGAGEESLAEEAVHLAATMLAAGAKGVVATMWSIEDCHGPMVSFNFYQRLIEAAKVKGQYLGKEKNSVLLDCQDSAAALDFAITELRRKVGDGEEGLLAWVPYVHWGV